MKLVMKYLSPSKYRHSCWSVFFFVCWLCFFITFPFILNSAYNFPATTLLLMYSQQWPWWWRDDIQRPKGTTQLRYWPLKLGMLETGLEATNVLIFMHDLATWFIRPTAVFLWKREILRWILKQKYIVSPVVD